MKKRIVFLCFFVLVATSCEQLLEVEPTHAVDVEVAISSYTGLKGILVDSYDDLQAPWAWGSAFTLLPEIMADNLDFVYAQGYYQGQFQNNFGSHMYAWIHETINQSNIIIANADRVKDDPGVTPADMDNLVGQAHAIRALFYFQMVNVYAYAPTAIVEDRNRGGVPLFIEPVTALSDIQLLPRAPIAEVYDRIVSDLKTAIALLDDQNAAASGRGYIGRSAAQALLSRAALFRGDWQGAVDAATAAIDAVWATLSTRESYGDDWELDLHPESFFTLYFETIDNVQNSPRLLYHSVDSRVPGFAGIGEYVPGPGFLDLLLEPDVRWQALQMGKKGRLETVKFLGGSEASWASNIHMIRLSEVYLNRAEAYARLNREAEAIADLDLLRARALGPDFAPTTASGKDLLDAILLERRLELAFEGLRWFDLKRLGMDVDKSQTTGEIIDFETDARILAPIPRQEMDLNPNMEQNVGY